MRTEELGKIVGKVQPYGLFKVKLDDNSTVLVAPESVQPKPIVSPTEEPKSDMTQTMVIAGGIIGICCLAAIIFGCIAMNRGDARKVKKNKEKKRALTETDTAPEPEKPPPQVETTTAVPWLQAPALSVPNSGLQVAPLVAVPMQQQHSVIAYPAPTTTYAAAPLTHSFVAAPVAHYAPAPATTVVPMEPVMGGSTAAPRQFG